MTRLEIYQQMQKLGIRHYILSATIHSRETDRRLLTITDGFHKCHRTDESFLKEIAVLQNRGYDFFDVIHLHD